MQPRKSSSFFHGPLVIFLVLNLLLSSASVLVPGTTSHTPPAAAATIRLLAKSYVTESGSTGNQAVSVLSVKDQTGTADLPSKYLSLLTAPNPERYRGYRVYKLPATIVPVNALSMQVKINYKGPALATQSWIWSLYNWNTGGWIRVGDNATATANRWTSFSFSVTNARPFINTGGQIRLQVRSSHAAGDAKLDYEALVVTFKQSPAAISTLSAGGSTRLGSAALNWSVPAGSAGNTDPAAYLIRYSSSPITTEAGWRAATPIPGPMPTPQTAGSAERFIVNNLTPGTQYYFSVRAQDVDGGLSALSNSPAGTPHVPTEVNSMEALGTAIEQANASPSGGILNLAAGNYTLLSAYAADAHNAFPVITKPVGIYGNNSVIARDAAAPGFRFFKVGSTGELYLQDITLQGGLAYDADWNSSENAGGAIYNDGGILQLVHCTLQNNDTSPAMNYISAGGALAIYDGDVSISNSSLVNNHAITLGGAILIREGILNVDTTEIKNNLSDAGTISVATYLMSETSPEIYIHDSVVSNNTAGGASAIVAQKLEITGSTIAENNSTGGMATISAGSQFIFRDSLLYKNLGGGIHVSGAADPASGPLIENSCIMANVPGGWTHGAVVYGGPNTRAPNNYWGEPDGPAGAGPGSGDGINEYVAYEPFATSPLAGCPVDPVLTGISMGTTARPYPHIADGSVYTIPGVPVQFSATLAGANGPDRSLTWSITSGEGSLSDTTGAQVTFTPPAVYQSTYVHVISQANPSFHKEMRIRTSKLEVKPSTRSLTVLTNSHAPVTAQLYLDNARLDYPLNEMAWQVVSGPGTLQGGGYSPLVYYAPPTAGQAVVRLSALVNPDAYLDIPITINSSGPAHCTEVSYVQGATFATVSMSGVYYNQPLMSRVDISEFDPLIGQQQTISVLAAVKSQPGVPATEPIQSASLRLITDTKETTYPMTLVAGTGLNGTWEVTLTADDTHCSIYAMEFTVTNAIATKTVTLTLR